MERKALSELRGNTLEVYIFLIKKSNAVGIRDVQKALNFSSPTLAAYHLEKLESLGLVFHTPEGYIPTKEIKVGMLAQVIKFGSLLLPRYIFYVGLFLSLLACYIIYLWAENLFEINIHSSFAILIAVLVILIMTYECIRIWKQIPF